MKIDYSKFEYNGAWYGDNTLTIGNKPINVSIMIFGRDQEKIPEESKEILEWYLDNCESLQDEVLNKIMDYYCDYRRQIGYDIEENEDYPLVSDISQISKMISFTSITIPNQKKFNKGVFLTFDCSWDEENGVGVRIVEGHVVEVGYEDIAL